MLPFVTPSLPDVVLPIAAAVPPVVPGDEPAAPATPGAAPATPGAAPATSGAAPATPGAAPATPGAALAAAGTHPDFSGAWVLDLKASGSMSEFLKSQGVGWLQRKAADLMPVTQHITQTETELTVKINSRIASDDKTLNISGEEVVEKTNRIGEVKTCTGWDETGQVLLTTTALVLPGGTAATWRIRRWLEDEGKTMVLDHALDVEDGRQFTVRRILRRPA